MVNFVKVYLDTTAPASPTISLDGGSTFAQDEFVDCTIGTGDETFTGYSMKIWGTVDPAYDNSVKATEELSEWITYSPTKQIKITPENGQKTIYLKLRDEVNNESEIVQDTITYDATKPVVTTTAPDVPRISATTDKNVFHFSFTSNEPFVEYRVMSVLSEGANETQGTIIPTANGSVNTSGTGIFDTTVSPIDITINGLDLQSVSSGDGEKVIKVFVQDEAGLWSS